MNLSAWITAADFLYRHSPASRVTRDKNVLLVRGRQGDALADALFELLFSTAYSPSAELHLIRLMPEGAQQRELDFLCRNERGIHAFARSAYSQDSEKKPLTIQFLDDADFSGTDAARRVAYAVDLLGQSPLSDADAWFSGADLPLLAPQGETWSALDERRCAVLDVARRVHTAYTAGRNSRYREERLSEELYGGVASGDDYCLRSSLRFAVSIPWKLNAAGAEGADDPAQALYEKLSADPAAMDDLTWQEHRSWQAFMTLEGWRMPTEEEMRGYMFRGDNDHRSKTEKLHPCLCDLEADDWKAPDTLRLRDTPIHKWSEAYLHQERYGTMDRMSLTVHHLCKEMVTSAEYAEEMNGLFRQLEDALIQSGCWHADAHILRAKRMENMFSRLRGNEMNSLNPWRRACREFEEKLESAPAMAEVRTVYAAIQKRAQAAEVRNKYCDYREIDTHILAWLPWIIVRRHVRTVFKLYAKTKGLENLLSSIILRPERLALVCEADDMRYVPTEIYRELLAAHGLDQIAIEVLDAAAFQGALPMGPDDAADVTASGSLQNMFAFPPDAHLVYYDRDDLQDCAQAPFFAPMYHPYDFSMTVDEVLRLRGLDVLSDDEDNEMLGMEEDYLALWDVRREIMFAPGKHSAWHYTVEALRKAENAVRGRIYPNPFSDFDSFRYPLSADAYRRMIGNGTVKVLHELMAKGCLADLVIDPAQGFLSFGLFPEAREKDRHETSLQSLRAMLEDESADSEYAVADDYVGSGMPFSFLNIRQPILLDAADIARQICLDEAREYKNGQRSGQPASETAVRSAIQFGVERLKARGLILPAGEQDRFFYRSLPIRRELEKEGFALEAYVYYTLFLSGAFDDIRSNVRLKTGVGGLGGTLEKELDILVTRKGRMGLISCKDTGRIEFMHLGEIKMQAEWYGVNARPILACSAAVEEDIEKMCRYLNVALISPVGKNLVAGVIRAMA